MKMKKINFDNDNLENENSSLSSLSASCCSNNSFSSVAENEISYAKLFNFPVQLNCIEMLDKTLDNYLKKREVFRMKNGNQYYFKYVLV